MDGGHIPFANYSQTQQQLSSSSTLSLHPQQIMEDSMHQQKLTCGTDEIRINIQDTFELKYWCTKFGVSRDELRNAVKAAGDSLTTVQIQLSNMPKTRQ
jgi:hypothetical protein